MKENDVENVQDPKDSKLAKAASVTAGVAAGTAAVTGAKLAHDLISENDEVIPLEDSDEIEVIADAPAMSAPGLNVENLPGFGETSSPIAENLHHGAAAAGLHHGTNAAPAHEAAAPAAEDHANAPAAQTVDVAPEQEEVEVLVDPIHDINGDLELNIVGYDTVTMRDGTQSDFAYFEHDGRQGAIVDIDQDGKAEYMMFDTNANGDIDEAEVYDIKDENWDMAMFNPGEEPADDLAQQVEPDVVEDQFYALDDASSDYINDADVNDFLEA